MKKTFASLLTVAALACGVATSALAESKGKEITINGKGCCAKCCLKETDSCQNAVTVEKDGKKTTYYLVQNDVSKAFHDNICKGIKPVTVTGTCKKVDGKLEVTASKIELAK
ncbi:MAG: hypothetical protein HY300_18670 [Verrucomicrobia bacterium]|nr:hypothetical protein [Verrucomicrobiota bacterium]